MQLNKVETISFYKDSSANIAYMRQEGNSPTIMFLSGFKSDMSGAKASALAEYCAKIGQSFLRFDYFGHGKSGGDFMQGTIGIWKNNALSLLDEVIKDKSPVENKVILVGSSMGGWLALLLAMERPEIVKAVIGIAAAPDFTERLIWNYLKTEEKKQLQREGVYYAPSCYGEDAYPITYNLIQEGRNHLLIDKKIDTQLPLKFPLYLLHGSDDKDVPVAIAHELISKCSNEKNKLTIIKGGDHRLSRPSDLELLCRTVQEVINDVNSK